MKKIFLTIFALTCVATASFLAWNFFFGPSSKYISQTIAKIHNETVDDKAWSATLSSGEKVNVILQHSCCTGIGFDAVIVWHTKEDILISRTNYCGLGALVSQVIFSDSKNYHELTKHLLNQGFMHAKL